MISVDQASQIITSNTQDFGSVSVPFQNSLGRVLAEDILADRDLPPFDRVMMDGIAIGFNTFEKGKRSFKIEGIQAAGEIQKDLQDSENAIEVMTGAVLPNGCDTVIRYEDLEIQDGVAKILIETIRFGQNVHTKGRDKSFGAVLIPKYTEIEASEIGILATVGKTAVQVVSLPKTIVVSTGDELVEINKVPEQHQIRRSNVYRVSASLEHFGIKADHGHLNDAKDQIRKNLAKWLQEYDVVILSGGVSKGKFDFIPDVLSDLGVQKHFHRVAQKPGKPFWFGTTESCRVFALPGNPNSSYLCTLRYVYPWLYRSIYKKPIPVAYAVLDKDFYFKAALTYFLQVHIENNKEGKLIAIPMKSSGSGDSSNLIRANAFMQLPADKTQFKKGEVYPILWMS